MHNQLRHKKFYSLFVNNKSTMWSMWMKRLNVISFHFIPFKFVPHKLYCKFCKINGTDNTGVFENYFEELSRLNCSWEWEISLTFFFRIVIKILIMQKKIKIILYLKHDRETSAINTKQMLAWNVRVAFFSLRYISSISSTLIFGMYLYGKTVSWYSKSQENKIAENLLAKLRQKINFPFPECF